MGSEILSGLIFTPFVLFGIDRRASPDMVLVEVFVMSVVMNLRRGKGGVISSRNLDTSRSSMRDWKSISPAD